MRITLSSIIVQEQAHALAFYRDKLGFVVKQDVPAGGARWITLASPQAPDGACISLEPAGFPWAQDYQRALTSAPRAGRRPSRPPWGFKQSGKATFA